MQLQITELSKTYRAKKSPAVEALKGISFDLPERGMVFILGKSGCGRWQYLRLWQYSPWRRVWRSR